MRARFGLLIATLLLLGGCVSTSNVDHGSAAGIRIGTPSADADSLLLQRGYTAYGGWPCEAERGHSKYDCRDGETLKLTYTRSRTLYVDQIDIFTDGTTVKRVVRETIFLNVE